MISEEMYEVMMHMIGYGQLDRNFADALQSCDHDLLLVLAHQCNDRWGEGSVNIELLIKNENWAGEE
tara:strand:+ start:2001 stop:2201 length:201 start_codon:yes stop_codon:yes gene_type:complete